MTNIDKYIEAHRERAGIEQAIKDEGATPERESRLKLARFNAKVAYAKLTGAQIGALRRGGVIQ